MVRGTLDLDKKGRNTNKDSWGMGSTEYLTRGYQPKLCTVYNLEVEDYHTYFVGEHGIWVHNKNPELLKPLPEAKFPSEPTNVYWETSGNIKKLKEEVYAYTVKVRDVITIVKDLTVNQSGYATQKKVLGKII